MGEAIERFFAALPARAQAAGCGPVSGTLQVNLTTGNRTEHWLVELRPRSARVSRGQGRADATWYGSHDLFERLITGREAGLAAMIRNESTFTGKVALFLAFRRFFPAPPGTRDPRETAREQAGRP
ncbi:SCP2 sterol-binding domain-containing protein [Micromonospora sp. R77]|uniref:SCP2 sterol-binding domain-containing protein n=1 Tax=Micromonospora sp. R77 TaxID=2925836 RepID=UPI001F61802A|nr:SCP2 sterol-binding domain-containing protein [Micromonospora sp. R77]MCI4062964.1 SCP2 sterol-binding domain-containing protein [Micromonospora sp. R77]